MAEIIKIKDIVKVYKVGNQDFIALNKVSTEFTKGEIIVILGPSGSGKTTLLNVISGLDNITSGHIFYDNTDITKLSDQKITKFRKEKISFIFQTYNLLEHLNVLENILIGKALSKNKIDVDKIIEVVGLKRHSYKKMSELSGGEQQRVSIARALAKNPQIMFCDEPTGALDEKNGKIVLKALVEINEKFSTTIFIVTHNPGIALIGDRIIKMNSGKIVEEKINARVDPKDISWGT